MATRAGGGSERPNPAADNRAGRNGTLSQPLLTSAIVIVAAALALPYPRKPSLLRGCSGNPPGAPRAAAFSGHA